MTDISKTFTRKRIARLTISLTAAIAILGALVALPFDSGKAAPGASESMKELYKRPAPNFDLNASRQLPNVRQATSAQLAALNNLKTSVNASNMTTRWNDFGGSPDVMYDFASPPYSGTPEEAARAFVMQNAGIFGVTELNNFRVFSSRNALGGHLVRFQQTFNGVAVENGGIGIVMNANKQVIMASGPFFRDVAVNTQPSLTAEQARTLADADLNQFHVELPAAATNLLQNGLSIISQQLAAVSNIPPTLSIYPTADGYRLAWKVARFSTNPFGLYMITVDANTGDILGRKDFLAFQTTPGSETADIYPKYPQIDANLKDHSIISSCTKDGIVAPCGQERVNLRSFDPSNRVTGVNGTLTGAHTIVNNALATKQPFGQAALGTWHFRKDDPAALEARTNEQDQLAEPAEHQDEINAFFFVTYLVEYVDYLHIGGDNTIIGGGAFPDDYPNKTTPLPATVHIPNIFVAIDAANGELPDPTHPDFVKIVLGMDNALAFNLTSLIEAVTATKSPVVVNPTVYGHGYLFNDLALEGTVPYHEGMHAITSPIAGLEGEEGSAMNEGQADMWAFTITDNASLGDYVVNAKGFRQYFRDNGRDPDSIAYIRSARSTLKYSDYGTFGASGQVEEHRDGEIYMSTLWDIREMMNRVYPDAATFKRPQTVDGLPQKSITRGTNIFERDFLGSMYILGTTSPDTMVKARDAFIVADQMLYPSDSTDPDAPGKHRAMIEQIFAAKELGINAREVSGGQATISTQVSHFAGGQAAPAVPQNVKVTPASTKSVTVTWDPVPGAVSYEVLKRKIAFAGRREPNGKRVFADGDASTTGYRHAFFTSGNKTSWEDNGPVFEVFAPTGVKDLFDSEYVVRAIGVNSTGQLGWSNLSGSSHAVQSRQDVTAQVDSAISNVSFANGVMAFDNRLTNARGAFSTDKTLYKPLEFQIVSISNPSVTVRNADANGNTFIYNETLTLGQTSSPKRIEFNDPAAQMFSFDAKIHANAFAGSTIGTGSQNSDGSSSSPAAVTYSVFTETKTGTLLAGEPTATGGTSATWGKPEFKGITWDDVLVTTKSDALALEGQLTSATAVDLDFELRTTDGKVLMRSAGATATEFVSSAVQPNTTYVFRVLGYANGPSTFQIVSNQLLPQGSPNENGGTRTVGGSSTVSATTSVLTRLVRFTVNPLTRTVSIRIL
ncbi:MAG TPA: M36 family metallopeptidase [Pyrinomonadaceae bacterium]|nr:M36 family metallopeptidase [Pyrinomonadaceae bacterium]